jgi:DNA-binding PadR family transcriptional regulator
VRRVGGVGLVKNENKILAAALRLAREGSVEIYGYELFAQLAEWGDEMPMNHGTVYRCLRRLEERGLFSSAVSRERTQGPPRVIYRLTDAGTLAARDATHALAADAAPPAWLGRSSPKAVRAKAAPPEV